MADDTVVTEIAPGAFRVQYEGTREIVYVAGTAGDRSAFWNGYVFRSDETHAATRSQRHEVRSGVQSLSAPIPAKVSKVLVSPGASITKGDTLVVLEAMKMEWPIRAPSSGTIKAVHCREGQLVQPEHALVDLE